jgi:hypothetical protein
VVARAVNLEAVHKIIETKAPMGGGPPEIHRQDDMGYIGGVGAMCLPEGTKHTWYSKTFGDGLTVELFLPHGTPQAEFHTTEPLCEVWKDASGNEIDPPADASSRSLRWPDFPWELYS